MTTLLGIDLGERRIGLAIGEPITGAVPLATVPRDRDPALDARAIRRALKDVAVDELVVGLPLELRSADEGPQAAATRRWAEALAAHLQLPLVLRDERQSSQIAEERLGRMSRGRSGGPPTRSQRDTYRARVDREAASIILQAELDARAAGADQGPREGAGVESRPEVDLGAPPAGPEERR